MRTPIHWYARGVIMHDGISFENVYMDIKETQKKKKDGSICSRFAIRILDHNEKPTGHFGCKTFEEAWAAFWLFVSAYRAEILQGPIMY